MFTNVPTTDHFWRLLIASVLFYLGLFSDTGSAPRRRIRRGRGGNALLVGRVHSHIICRLNKFLSLNYLTLQI